MVIFCQYRKSFTHTIFRNGFVLPALFIYKILMQFSKRWRITVIIALIVVLCSLFVSAGIDRPPVPELGAYPGAEEIAQQPDKYENQRVSLVGQVVSVDPVVVSATYGTDTGIKSTRLEITKLTITVERGDRLQVFGTLTDSQRIRISNVTVVPQSGRWYAWGISFIAGLWVLGRIINQWNVDYNKRALYPRSVSLISRFSDHNDNDDRDYKEH